MRPIRLHVQGFTSFREATDVDFTDVDYFALVGPTGSGKSSIIDAMCFALYGTIPRLENRTLVAPVITQGQLEAKVSLEFSINGKSYTAARVVRRSGKRATTREARLECDGEVLAGSADEVTDAATDLIGLPFEHFTKCVVLPQGEFARFLHDKPSARQDMLVNLLGLEVYERMCSAANTRSATSKSSLALNEQRLSKDLAFASAAVLGRAKARLKELEDLLSSVKKAEPQLAELTTSIETSRGSADEAAVAIRKLESLSAPEDLGELEDALTHAQKALKEAEETHEQAGEESIKTHAALAELPEKASLITALKAHERKASTAKEIAAKKNSLQKLRVLEAEANVTLQKAGTALDEARGAEATVRDQHRALHLAGSLETGKPCPVCLQDVAVLPAHPEAPALEAATVAMTGAEATRAEAGEKLTNVTESRVKTESQVATLQEQLNDIEIGLGGLTDPVDLERQLNDVDMAQKALGAARVRERQATADANSARSKINELREDEMSARSDFNAKRDTVAPLGPPPVGGRDLASDWRALVKWAAERVAALEKQVVDASQARQEQEMQRDDLVKVLAESCRTCGLNVEIGDNILEVVVAERTSLAGEVAHTEEGIAEAAKLRKQIKALTLEAELAGQLGKHLSAKGFKQWIVNEALQRLVTGATAILGQLSNGQYSLALDSTGNFLVTDHENADETRSARTLSGGETFLASLSLALSLSDQLMELAARGAARLDAIFLDEGFGTLDTESLGTVAATIENLATGGRMVGVITHVSELAERITTRFQVTKDAHTSKIAREQT